jgi:hypothetical protein
MSSTHQIETLPISQINPNPENPRSISKLMFEKLKKSLQDFPEMLYKRPLVVDEDNTVLGGNMRLMVLKELNYREVPVIRAEGWTEKQKQEFVVKDNVAFGEWDWDVLANEWDVDSLDEWGVALPVINEKLEPVGNEEPEIKVTEEILEEHNYIVFTFDNQLDWQVAKEMFDIGTVAKPGFTDTYMQKGVGRVRKGTDLIEKLNKR